MWIIEQNLWTIIKTYEIFISFSHNFEFDDDPLWYCTMNLRSFSWINLFTRPLSYVSCNLAGQKSTGDNNDMHLCQKSDWQSIICIKAYTKIMEMEKLNTFGKYFDMPQEVLLATWCFCFQIQFNENSDFNKYNISKASVAIEPENQSRFTAVPCRVYLRKGFDPPAWPSSFCKASYIIY